MERTWLVVVLGLVGCDEPLVTKLPSRTVEDKVAHRDKVAPHEVREHERIAVEKRPDDRPAIVQVTPEPAQQVPAKSATPAAIEVFEVDAPMSLAIAGDTLMWTDPKGSLWSMPSRGGTPVELSHQHLPGRPMYGNLAAHAGAVIASREGDLVRVAPPQGALEPLGLALGSDSLLELASDGTALYATSFEHRSAIYKIVDGTKTKLLDHNAASIAVAGDTLYAVSYSTGVLVSVSTSGGTPRTIARGLAKTTGFAIDATSAYVWGEKDAALRKVDLKTGRITVLAKDGLSNTDVLVADGDWIYAHSWIGAGKSTFVRVAKDGSQTQILANDLSAPYDIAVDADAVFVSVRDQDKIIRFDKRAIKPLPVSAAPSAPSAP